MMNAITRTAFKTIVRKEITRFLRIWPQTLLPPAITMGLYFIIFGNLIGKQIGTVHGFTYMQYIVPGLVMMSMITNAYANVSTSFFGTKFQRNIDEMLIAPIPNYVILLGYIIGGTLRGLAVGIIVSIIALLFTHLYLHNILVTLFVAFFSVLLFSLAGFTNGLFARKFDDVSIIPTFVITPLTYLGGVFYSIQMLPGFWQDASKLNPILYMVDAFRYGILGVSDIPVAIGLGMIILFTVALFLVNLHLMNRGYGLKS